MSSDSLFGIPLCRLLTAVGADQTGHGSAHGLANVHVGLCIAAVVAIGGAAMAEGMGIDRRDIALELRHVSREYYMFKKY